MNLKHELWICPDKRAKKNPTGTQADPYPVTTREGFDGILSKSIIRGQELHLYPGIYRTQGCWAHPEIGPVRIYGHGYAEIVLVVKPEELPFAQYGTQKLRRPDVAILTCRTGVGHSEVENVILDGTKVDPSILVTGGLNSEGTLTARNVSVRGIRGQWEQHAQTGLYYEAFGIRSFGSQGGTHVEDCEVFLEPDSYGNGVTIGHVPNYQGLSQPLPSVVARTAVYGGKKGHCGFTASSSTRIVDCAAYNVNHCIYQDTAGAQNVLVENFDGISHWAFIRLHSHNALEHYRTIKVRNAVCGFKLNEPNKDCIALALTHTGDPAQFDDIDVDVRITQAPGNYYAVSSSLPQPNLRYQLQDHVGTGRINLPAWSLPKSKAKAAAGPVMPQPVNPKAKAKLHW